MRKALAALFVLGVPGAALACPVCFGQNDSPMASAANLGILVMLVIVVCVLTAFATFFIYLARRARMFATEEPSAATSAAYGPSKVRPTEGTAEC